MMTLFNMKAFIFVAFSCANFVPTHGRTGHDLKLQLLSSPDSLTKDNVHTRSHYNMEDTNLISSPVSSRGHRELESTHGVKTTSSRPGLSAIDSQTNVPSRTALAPTASKGEMRRAHAKDNAAFKHIRTSLLTYRNLVHPHDQQLETSVQSVSSSPDIVLPHGSVQSSRVRKHYLEIKQNDTNVTGRRHNGSSDGRTIPAGAAASVHDALMFYKHQSDDSTVQQDDVTAVSDVSMFKDPSNSVMQRVRRGSTLEMLPDNYHERQTHFSNTETCRTLMVSRVMQPPGCQPRRVVSSACQGTCHSRTVPEWHYESQQVRHVSYCTCCKPHQLTHRRVRFRCPVRPQKLLLLLVGVAAQCACRPCSDGDPEAQQPYDYD